MITDDWSGAEQTYKKNILSETAERAIALAIKAFRARHCELELEGAEHDAVEITHELVGLERLLKLDINAAGDWIDDDD